MAFSKSFPVCTRAYSIGAFILVFVRGVARHVQGVIRVFWNSSGFLRFSTDF